MCRNDVGVESIKPKGNDELNLKWKEKESK